MMENAKYIVYREPEFGALAIVVFSPILIHAQVAKALGAEVESAGFVSVGGDGSVECYGESESLQKKCNKVRDSRLAAQLLGKYS
jgi:hypothetical protein